MYSILHSDSVVCSPMQRHVTMTYRDRGRGGCTGFLMMKTTEGLRGSYWRCFFYFHIVNVLSIPSCLIRELWNHQAKT